MQKTLIFATILLALGLSISGDAPAQQSSTPGTQKPAASGSSSGAASGSSTAPKATASKTPAKPAAKPAASTVPDLSTPKAKDSYALGLNIGRGLQRQSVDIDPAIVARGLQDGLSGAKPLMEDADVESSLKDLQAQAQKAAEEKRQAASEKNMKEGTAFLADNKTKEGVVTLPSGLQYKVLQTGNGPKPAATDTVVCNYRGTLLDGTEFDSSYKRGQPATFPLNRVIKGWTEALQLMPVGSKWQLFIPPDLAYGGNGAGNVIGPNATLIFEVELVSIQAPNPPPGQTQSQPNQSKPQ